MDNRSQQENTTSSAFLVSTSECIVWLTVFGIEAAAIVTLNALTVIIYLKEYSLRKRSMFLVINLAAADFFVGGCVIIECWLLGTHCDLWVINISSESTYLLIGILMRFLPLASTTTLAAISLERMHATFRPFRHRLIKKEIFGAAVVVVWITTGFISIITGLEIFVDIRAFLILYFSFLLFSFLIILVSYSSIAVKIGFANQPHHHGATSKERKLTKTLFIVTLVSLLLTLPSIIFWLLYLSQTITNIKIRMIYTVIFLFYANSLVNPMLYTFRIPEFRRALFSFLRCRSQPQLAWVFPLDNM